MPKENASTREPSRAEQISLTLGSNNRVQDDLKESDEDAIKEFKASVEKVWEEESDAAVSQNGLSREDCKLLFDQMIMDRPQLSRILVARKYEMEACVDLFFEQLRFRARWKPQTIQVEDVPNALPCKCGCSLSTVGYACCPIVVVSSFLLTQNNNLMILPLAQLALGDCPDIPRKAS